MPKYSPKIAIYKSFQRSVNSTYIYFCLLLPFLDPHIISFHGVGYDYQHGCDNVLVDLPNLKIHARFVKYLFTGGTGFSYIEGMY